MEALYYLVWRKNGGRKPNYRHATLDSAQQEALRLSAESPQAKFLVLAVVAQIGPTAEQEPVAA